MTTEGVLYASIIFTFLIINFDNRKNILTFVA